MIINRGNRKRTHRYLIACVLFSLLLFKPANVSAFSKSVNDSVVPFRFQLKYEGSTKEINPNYRYILEYLVEIMLKNPNLVLHIRGHVCCGPGEKLSTQRAKRVYRFLCRQGVPQERMSYKGYSNTIPLSKEKIGKDETRNRRVDFILTYK